MPEIELIDEIAREVKGFGDGIATMRADLEAKIEAVQARNDALESALKRLPFGNGIDVANVLTPEQKAFRSFLRHGVEKMPEAEKKSLTLGSNTDGGYLAVAQFETDIIKKLVQISPLRAYADVRQTSAGTVVLPKRTGQPTGQWVGETQTRTESQSTYGQSAVPLQEMAVYTDTSIRLLEDSAVSVENEIGGDLTEEFGRLEGAAFINGNGVGQPMGIMQDPNVSYVATGAATAITADSLVTILYNLPAFYRNQSTWLMNGSTLATVRTLKDGDGSYLWQPSLQLGQPEMILGRPVAEMIDMPSVGAGNYPIMVGAIGRAYRIYDRVNGMTILRDPYSLATSGMVRFHARRRVGGKVVLSEALRKLKVSVS